MKIIFMGTPAFSVHALDEIIKAGHEVIAVYSQPPRPAGRGQKLQFSPVHQLALANKIPVFTPKTLKDPQIQNEFQQLNAELTVVAAYGLILPKPILDACRCINIHASLLPRWRGAAPIERAIMAGDKKSGITIMDMDEGLDTGDIILTREVSILPDMTAGHLHDELSGMGAKLLIKAINLIENKADNPVKQQGNATYAAKIMKGEAKIDWNQYGEQIILYIRAFNPTPGAYFEYKNEKIKILEADFVRDMDIDSVGIILDDKLTISCQNGKIIPQLVQRQGKKIMPLNEMLNGFRVEVGVLV